MYWLPIYFTFTPDIQWPKQLGEIKMACCKACHGQLVARSVTWASHRSPNQQIRHSQEHQSVFLNISLQAKYCEASECLGTVSGLITTLRQRILKLHGGFPKHCEVVSKTALRTKLGTRPIKIRLSWSPCAGKVLFSYKIMPVFMDRVKIVAVQSYLCVSWQQRILCCHFPCDRCQKCLGCSQWSWVVPHRVFSPAWLVWGLSQD